VDLLLMCLLSLPGLMVPGPSNPAMCRLLHTPLLRHMLIVLFMDVA
jgi:hypothetical protein